MSALYGAAGIRHDPELTQALLEAGADPNDGESVYHSTEAESPDCLRILLEHGAEQRADTNDNRPRPRRRAPGAPPAAARARRRPERGLLRGARRPARSRAGDDRAPGLGRADVEGRAVKRGAATCRCGCRTARRSAREGRPCAAARAARRVDGRRSGGRRRRLDRARRATDDAAPGDTGSRRAGGNRALGAEREPRPRARPGRGRLPGCRLRLTRRDAAPPRRLDIGLSVANAERLLERGADPVGACPLRHAARLGGVRLEGLRRSDR